MAFRLSAVAPVHDETGPLAVRSRDHVGEHADRREHDEPDQDPSHRRSMPGSRQVRRRELEELVPGVLVG